RVRVALKRDILRTTETCDVLVCADGIASELRARLTAGADAPVKSGLVAFRSMFEAPASLTRAPGADVRLWLAPGGHLVAYRVPGARINLVLVADAREAPGDAPPPRLRRRFSGDAARLIEAAPGWRQWPLHSRPAPTNWSSGPIALLGDAAHAMPPFLGQGAAQALEDSAALAEAFGAEDDIASALARYGASRAPRAARVTREATGQAAIYHASGPRAFARDLALRAMGGDRIAARYDWLYGG
ncbi:MAG: FAD-dependent monooxygenase, partial [Hyphomicrobiales bacterium]|nr:FAD-dependent monooxygenase [Hyphomicrobiales bacterium]